jgi:hypothetical protein
LGKGGIVSAKPYLGWGQACDFAILNQEQNVIQLNSDAGLSAFQESQNRKPDPIDPSILLLHKDQL